MPTEKEITQVAKQAAKAAVATFKAEEDGFEVPVTPMTAASKAHELFDDIFTDIGEKRMQEMKMTRYTIYKNSEMAATKPHPYSWEKIQREFGPGHYRIVAKDEQGTIVKQQSKSVADLSQLRREAVEFEFGDQAPRPAPASGPGFMEMFTMLRETESNAKQEAREAAKESNQSNNALLSTVLTLMQNQQQAAQAMILEMSKSSQAIAEKLSENQNRMFERLNDQIQKVAENRNGKSDGVSSLEVMKMVQDAEDRGFKRFKDLNDLADEKAEEKLELLEEAREAGGGKGEKKSIFDSLIETSLPTIMTAVSNMQKPAQPQPPQIGTAPAQPRRAVRAVPPVGAGGGTHQNPGSAGGSSQSPRNGGSGGGNRQRPRAAAQAKVNDMGLPTTPTKASVKTAEKKGDLVTEGLTKEKVLEIVVPLLGAGLTGGKDPSVVASESKVALESAGWSLNQTLAIFSKEDMIKLVKENNLPTETIPWLESYYANLEEQAGVGLRRQSPADNAVSTA